MRGGQRAAGLPVKPRRRAIAGFGVTAVVGLATLSAGQPGAAARAAPDSGEAGAELPSIAALQGQWNRNATVSEDPIRKTESLWRNPERTSTVLTGLAASLAERVGRLRLRAVDGQVHVRNARNETLALPTDGSIVTDEFGNRHRARVLPGVLEIETARPGWLLVETFFRQGEELHRVIEIQSESFPNLRFLTVYDSYGGRPFAVDAGDDEAGRFLRPAAIRIVPPRRSRNELLAGRIEVETLIVDRSIDRVDFLLDGRRIRQARKLPFRGTVNLATPSREQTLEVRAWNVRGAFTGGDRLTLNRLDPPFGIRIRGVAPSEPDGATTDVETRVAVPRGASLERVDFYRNEELARTVDSLAGYGAGGGFRTVRGNLPTPDVSPNDYVRVTATLADGRELEDAQLIEGVTFKGEVDVQLVHLQVLVVDADGAPVGGLTAADFRIVEDGERKTVQDVRQAGEVPLVLGMTIDSSASMRPIWNQLRSVVGTFLENSLAAGDRAFLVDFDESVRLLQRPTGSLRALRTSMDRLVPNGGTAVNDGILFSLILYGDEPGRRALVVVTDGVDIDSRSEPELAAAYAARVGVPLYFVDLGRDRIALRNAGAAKGDGAGAPLIRTARSADEVRRMRQQARQSGGRLFRIDPELPPPAFLNRVQTVFDEIREDLRRQQVLTYYSGRPLGAAIDPEVHVVREGLAVKSVLPLDRVDPSAPATDYTYTAPDTEGGPLPTSVAVAEVPAERPVPLLPSVVAETPAERPVPSLPSAAAGTPVERPVPPSPVAVEKAPADLPAPRPPVEVRETSFRGATIPDQTWVQYEPLTPLTLPAASGGDGVVAYGLTPALPAGLSFDLASRVLWGTPSTPRPATRYTYTATDETGNVAALSFLIAVNGAARDDAAIVSILGLPSRMATGRGATVTLTVRNTGTTTWTPFGGYGLGSRNPRDNDTWGLRRAPLPRSVAPNETVVFEFPITAPESPGSHTFSWRMVRDPGGWFGSDTGNVTVSVEVP